MPPVGVTLKPTHTGREGEHRLETSGGASRGTRLARHSRAMGVRGPCGESVRGEWQERTVQTSDGLEGIYHPIPIFWRNTQKASKIGTRVKKHVDVLPKFHKIL